MRWWWCGGLLWRRVSRTSHWRVMSEYSGRFRVRHFGTSLASCITQDAAETTQTFWKEVTCRTLQYYPHKKEPKMAPSAQAHSRNHSLLLLQKLLNLRDSASPLTLVLDTVEQSAGPLVREFMTRAKVGPGCPASSCYTCSQYL